EGGGDGAAAGVVPVVVEVLELLGNEVIFHGRAGDDVLIAKTAPRRAPTIGTARPPPRSSPTKRRSIRATPRPRRPG
ncbi:MAG TPA: hypothetical protein VLT84_01475, partial [Acidobacteriota bacterium]|nr:hypothetical protein [Acidobacteriota bacterium]